MGKTKIKPTYFLTVYHSKEELLKRLIGEELISSNSYVEILGRLCGDKELRQRNLPQNTKYVPPTCELLSSINVEIVHFGRTDNVTLHEVKTTGSNRNEFNVHGWCTDQFYKLGTRPL